MEDNTQQSTRIQRFHNSFDERRSRGNENRTSCHRSFCSLPPLSFCFHVCALLLQSKKKKKNNIFSKVSFTTFHPREDEIYYFYESCKLGRMAINLNFVYCKVSSFPLFFTFSLCAPVAFLPSFHLFFLSDFLFAIFLCFGFYCPLGTKALAGRYLVDHPKRICHLRNSV